MMNQIACVFVCIYNMYPTRACKEQQPESLLDGLRLSPRKGCRFRQHNIGFEQLGKNSVGPEMS